MICDSSEIEQITNNIHRKPTDIYIPCITAYNSFLGKADKYSNSAEIFFEYCALHKSRGLELKQRKDPVRIFRTSPIQEKLIQIANEEYETNSSLN